MARSNIKQTAVIVALMLCLARVVFAQTPGQQVQETIHRVTAIIGSSSSAEPDRLDEIKRLLLPRFDWPEMAKRSLGKHWPKVPERQNEFISAFTEFVSNAYLGTISGYKDERIVFAGERREQNLAEVDTKLMPNKGDPMPVNYRLHLVQGEWKIYDVVIADISLINNYRSQFNRILAKASFDDLVKQLRDKDSRGASYS
ncbi:MAG TPA: ABC transporter substrate-binding protein [Candidatus Binatia bacterium]|nr:ABC transporter substrate-binding protein [Candidatus Binatia bacterium]